jgi:hypothetical protein
MAKGIGRNGELFRVLCDRARLIRSARAAAKIRSVILRFSATVTS